MNARLTLVTAALAVVACHESPAEPPSGLPVTVVAVGGPTAAPVITSTGNSVVIVVSASELPTRSCSERRGAAGIREGTLVVTVTTIESGFVCPMPDLRNLRVSVGEVPSGQYELSMVHRSIPVGDKATEQEVLHAQVAVP
jgi:hypothetical protein